MPDVIFRISAGARHPPVLTQALHMVFIRLLDYSLYILIMGVTIHDTLLDIIDFYNRVKKRTDDYPTSVDTYPIVQFHPYPVLYSI